MISYKMTLVNTKVWRNRIERTTIPFVKHGNMWEQPSVCNQNRCGWGSHILFKLHVGLRWARCIISWFRFSASCSSKLCVHAGVHTTHHNYTQSAPCSSKLCVHADTSQLYTIINVFYYYGWVVQSCFYSLHTSVILRLCEWLIG